jgi:hypothetical protein
MGIVRGWTIGLRSSTRVNRGEDDERQEWCRSPKRRKRSHGMGRVKMVYFVRSRILSAESISLSQEARNEMILI